MSAVDGPEELVALLRDFAKCARIDVHDRFNVKDGRGYTHVKRPITEQVIREHLDGRQPIAVVVMAQGRYTQAAVLDIDDHDGELGWERVVERVLPLYRALIDEGLKPIPFRSGGGKGIHLWFLWREPQLARSVRRRLTRLLDGHGLKPGTRGIGADEVEVFPKQDEVPEGRVGNVVALPLARKSEPLDELLQPISRVVYRPPALEAVYCPDVPDNEDGVPKRHGAQQHLLGHAPHDVVLDGDLEEALAALKHIQADDYAVWIRMGLILKHAFDDAGFEVWRGWSETSASKYPGEARCRRDWDNLKPTGEVGLGSLFHAAQEGGWNGPADPVIREMNARFGILTHGNKTMIIVKNGDRRDDEDLVWLSKPTFQDRLAPETILVDADVAGNTKWIAKGPYWLGHPRACHYHRIIFDPAKPPGHNGRDWNLWTGFAVEPMPGTWDRLKDHILHNICQGDEDAYDWLLNWMALGVQTPGAVIGTAPVLHGLPGTGKGFLANAYGRLWGRHYVTITHRDQVTGRFNAHLVGRRLVFIDEGTFGGDRREAGVIKTRITEPWVILEAKGVDPIKMRNRLIFMIASNEASIVPADLADRRWQVFEVGDRNREDQAYFASIQAELEAGGYAAMLDELLRRDISAGPDPRKTVKTEALFEQIIRAQGPELRYLYQILDDGLLPQQDAPGNSAGATTIGALWENMRKTQANANYVTRNALGRFMQRTIPGVTTVQSGTFIIRRDPHNGDETERSTRYHFPPLADCRRAFAAHVGQAVPWSNDLIEWQEVNPADGWEETPF